MVSTKERNSAFVTVRVKPGHRDRLRAIAEREERKMSEIVRRAIRMYLDSLGSTEN